MPVVGMGGYFFRASDPAALKGWYKEKLGVGGGCGAGGTRCRRDGSLEMHRSWHGSRRLPTRCRPGAAGRREVLPCRHEDLGPWDG